MDEVGVISINILHHQIPTQENYVVADALSRSLRGETEELTGIQASANVKNDDQLFALSGV